ncbi:hypothetical protein SBA1_1180006 [Candidatus Sulfotelmatobacter kueseliae]|uniref:Uncharacterized protein n=1 Tax=Candidatus Sulfotelmatobacter kueseliae TaxID=2042962 RepID=A0A2U3K195_9BACT|nr:hypothetical protein SBA1_1180006 [Candidatus Sulfotelmatobacter kueseliae]
MDDGGMGKASKSGYLSDVTDEEWALAAPCPFVTSAAMHSRVASRAQRDQVLL